MTSRRSKRSPSELYTRILEEANRQKKTIIDIEPLCDSCRTLPLKHAKVLYRILLERQDHQSGLVYVKVPFDAKSLVHNAGAYVEVSSLGAVEKRMVRAYLVEVGAMD